MIHHDGFYYYSESQHEQRNIVIRRSRTIGGIGQDAGVCVWRAPEKGRNCHAVWAPELHRLGGKWFIYYAADDGRNENHRMWVLESEGDDPLGRYHCRGELQTGGWAIDGTVLELDGGKMFFIWSGWPGRKDGGQNLYIAPMRDAVTLAGKRTLICQPDQPWEQVAMPICEGPQVLRRNGDIFIVYSASASWTPDYCLGLLHNQTQDPLNPAAWQKHHVPVFQKTEQVWGVGHCSFVKSLCQTEDWILYHSKSEKTHGWNDRDVHAKRFTWTPEGLPDFGAPLPRRVPVLPMFPPPLGAGNVPLAA
ncbi:MAG: Alpha-N-arabinofuranosidase [Pedosphaera sp.]|nr:Alpha-N-arabinofuranosidase [Pedosphaera sp.]